MDPRVHLVLQDKIPQLVCVRIKLLSCGNVVEKRGSTHFGVLGREPSMLELA